jgi:ribosome-associated protein
MPRPPTPDPSPRPPALPTADAPLPPSKSQRKRDAHALQALGVQLVALSAAQLARLALPEALHEAVVAAQRMRAYGARTRQMQYIGKIMRQLEPAVLSRIRMALTPGRAVTPAAPAREPAGTAPTGR